MLELKDFFHLPEIDRLVEQLAAAEPGLMVVAGPDALPQPAGANPADFLPSGRAGIFRILLRQILTAQPTGRVVVVTESQDPKHLSSRQLGRRVIVLPLPTPEVAPDQIAAAVRQRPDLLVVDHLTVDSAAAAAEAAGKGLAVLAQIDTVFQGSHVAWALEDLGVPAELLRRLRWVVSVQRMPTLCQHCKQPVVPDLPQLAELARRYPIAFGDPGQVFYRAAGCEQCGYSGRLGDVVLFDVFRAPEQAANLFEHPSVLSLGEYALRLAAGGHLSLDDALSVEADRLRRTHRLLSASEHALRAANEALQRKLAELEAAHRVLQQRTEALVSLQEIGQALIGAGSLPDLAQRICHHARELCGADRAILYYLRSAEVAEVLAFSGWAPARVPREVPAGQVVPMAVETSNRPAPFDRWPPGIPKLSADVEGAELRGGLYVPLVAQERTVGAMIVHSTRKPRFAPGQVALLQTFAYQAALAIQRAGLIEQLRQKIRELEAAQAGLIRKERLERELELAREVQQSVLPKTFPAVPGYSLAAWNEPARQVGGDFYDVFELDDDHIGLVVGDVSDKGMPAALYMALTRSLLLAEARRELSPRAVLLSVNQLLQAQGQPRMFVTVFYAVLECSTRRLRYARAGHDRPMLVRHGAVRELGGRGALLGMLASDETLLAEEQLDLEPGDRLVLYTDGLTDLLSPDGQEFGREHLAELLETHTHLPVAAMCTAVAQRLAAYQAGAEQYDDMTMLVLDVT